MHKIKMIMQLYKDRYVQNLIYTVLGNSTQKGLSLIVSIITARLLQNELFGVYSIIRNFIEVFSLLLLLGLDRGLIYFISIESIKKNVFKILYNSIILFLIITTLLSIGFYFISIYIYELMGIKSYVTTRINLLLYFNIVSYSFSLLLIGAYIGMKQLRIFFSSAIIAGIIYLIFGYFLTIKCGMEGALIALIIQYVLQIIILISKLRNNINILSVLNFNVCRKLISFSIPLGIGEITFQLIGLIISLMLALYGGIGEVGVYNAAMRWIMVVVFIPNVLGNLVLSYSANNNKYAYINRVKSVFIKNVIINLFITSTITIAIYLGGDWLESLYGTSFVGFKSILTYLMLGVIPYSIGVVCNQILISLDMRWIQMFLRIFRQILLLIVSYILITNYNGSASSLAIGFAITNTLVTIIMLVILVVNIRIIKIGQLDKTDLDHEQYYLHPNHVQTGK